MALKGPPTSAEVRHLERIQNRKVEEVMLVQGPPGAVITKPAPAPDASALTKGIADDPETVSWAERMVKDRDRFLRRTPRS